MSDTTFAIQILASTTALCAAYALVMAIIKREPNVLWTRGTAILTLLGTGTAFGFGYSALFGNGNIFHTISMLFLILALGNALALVVVHRFKMSTAEVYNPQLLYIARVLAFIITISLLLHVGLEFAAIAGF